MRKYRVLSAVMAALMLGGCTIKPTAEEKLKPIPREYDDSVAEVVYSEPKTEYDDTEPDLGKPLVYKDFCVGSDFDFFEKMLGEKSYLYGYFFWNSYNDDGEWYRYPSFWARMYGNDNKEAVLAEYGVEEKPYDMFADKYYLHAIVTDQKGVINSVQHCDSYCEAFYPINTQSPPFEEYAHMRMYFDGDDLALCIMGMNYDLTLLSQCDWKKLLDYSELYSLRAASPEGERLIPRVMLKGMASYERLRTDLDYPVFDFENGYVSIQWYDYDGNETEGEGLLKSGLRLKYTLTDTGIDLELPDGGDSMSTYISYNKYLDAYELHDPYWRDNYGCTLMLGKAVQQKVGE